MISSLLQQALGLGMSLLTSNAILSEQHNTTGASSIPSSPSTSSDIANSFVGILSLLMSFSSLWDWLKWIVLGGFFEMVRRCYSSVYDSIMDRFYLNIYFQEDDPSYDWMMVWLSRQPSWAQARDVEISTSLYGGNSTAVVLDGEDDVSEIGKSSRKIAYLPSISRTYSIWYKRRRINVIRTQQQTGYNGRKEQTLNLSILTLSNKILLDILQEARTLYMQAQRDSVCIYVADNANNWRHASCRSKRSMSSVILNPGVKDLLIEDARDFLGSKEWYSERGIPFRRGYLLYGVPGSGKTSLIHSIAGELSLDLYVVSLSRAGMDDTALSELINELPERCIALMEDIDAAFTRSLNRAVPKPQDVGQKKDGTGESSERHSGAPSTQSGLSLSGLLNALDGVGAQEGRILFATTNHYTALDLALSRPGRMDLHIEFKNASKYQAAELFYRFYVPSDVTRDKLTDDVEDSVNSGYSTLSTTWIEEEKSMVIGTRHIGRPPKMSGQHIKVLASQFAQCIPEMEVSMASLQGYLMAYKIRPVEAVKDAAQWVEKQRQQKSGKVKEPDEEMKAAL